MFEDVAQGLIRKIDLNRKHVAPPEPSWWGDSVGHWEGSTLVVDTKGFGDPIWINDKGLPVSPELHIMERVRLGWRRIPGISRHRGRSKNTSEALPLCPLFWPRERRDRRGHLC